MNKLLIVSIKSSLVAKAYRVYGGELAGARFGGYRPVLNLFKAQYVSNIFYVISIYTTKLSTAKFFLSLCSSNTATRIVSWLVRSMVLWIFISVITLLAQCHLPHPWNSFDGKCIDLVCKSLDFSPMLKICGSTIFSDLY